MSNILLTGASGFVGRQTARALIARGHRLRLVLRRGGFARSGLPDGAAEIIETDDLFAEDADWWADALSDIDTVIHAAWYVEPGKYLDSPHNIDCTIGSLMIAEGALRAAVRKFIGIGTCFEYRLPNAAITEASEPGPVTLYAAAKLALCRMLEKRFAGTGVDFAWARLFYLYGEGEHPARLFPLLHRKLSAGEPMVLSAGDKIRDFLDVADAGRLIATLAETGQTGIANICSGRPVTIREVAEEIADIYGRRDLLTFGAATLHPRDPEAVAGICNVKPS
jgi:dTDP-6-deoxy-L-talose 4-dehydrogenase (NAD+)